MCLVADEATLSDGTAGGVEGDSITFPAFAAAVTTRKACAEAIAAARMGCGTTGSGAGGRGAGLVDALLLVEEADIAAGVLHALDAHHKVIEGSAGAAVGFVLRHGTELLLGCDVVVVCVPTSASAVQCACRRVSLPA